MKYLEISTLDHINAVLSSLERTGDCRLVGRIEAYSCKPAGEDKKLYKNLENKYSEEHDEHDNLSIVSPFGPLTQQASRKTLYYLIATLNASFTDYDFSNVKAEQFTKQPLAVAVNYISMSITQAGALSTEFTEQMWQAIDKEISVADCLRPGPSDIYVFTPDADSDPYAEEGALWSFNYFFYNKKKKRIILLTSSYINLLSPKLAGAVGTLDEDLEGLDNENDPDDERGPFRMDLEPPRRTSSNWLSYDSV